MTLQEEIRIDLDNEVFGVFGKTITLINKSSPIYNSRGELEGYSSTSTNIVVVPYNIISKRQTYQSFGNLEEGEMDVAVRYDQSIVIDDTLLIDSDYYKVKDISKNYLPDNVVSIIRVTRTEPVVSDDIVPTT